MIIPPRVFSYSALSDWVYCPKYYYLSHILKVRTFKASPDTAFGKIIHTTIQDLLLKKITKAQALKHFSRKWSKLCGIYKLNEKHKSYGKGGENIINAVEDKFKEYFKEYEVLKVEERVQLKITDRWPQIYKGFIDLILTTDNKIVIADIKTAWSAYMFVKFKETVQDYQIVSYKHLFSKLFSVDPKDIGVCFIVVEKNPKSKNPIHLIPITSGKVKVGNALKLIDRALAAINRSIFPKNRVNCFKYGEGHPCDFYNTEHCPKSFGNKK